MANALSKHPVHSHSFNESQRVWGTAVSWWGWRGSVARATQVLTLEAGETRIQPLEASLWPGGLPNGLPCGLALRLVMT